VTLTREELKEETLHNLRMGLNFLTGSDQTAARLVISLHLTALDMMKLHDCLSAEEAVMEVRRLYAAVEAEHPGAWEELGGPRLPKALT
jgi:hypothetical protein